MLIFSAYRFQLAGYRDEKEYKQVNSESEVLNFIHHVLLILFGNSNIIFH